jgi:hypothetical protein
VGNVGLAAQEARRGRDASLAASGAFQARNVDDAIVTGQNAEEEGHLLISLANDTGNDIKGNAGGMGVVSSD